MSGGLENEVRKFKESLEKRNLNLLTLLNDIQAMKDGIANEKPYSRQTVEPVTRIRKSTDELKDAQDNPNETFINDRINDILGK